MQYIFNISLMAFLMTEGQYHWYQLILISQKNVPLIFDHWLAIQLYIITKSYQFEHLLDFKNNF